MRKYYIDNMRWLAILMLFPYHIFMIYNTFGESFYVKGVDIQITSGIIVATGKWFMPLLFTMAGASSAYALEKRNSAQYIKERFAKLFIPLFFGILLLVPPQTYFSERFHNNYTGGYFEQYILFFTKPTDLTGYHGGFTPAHLWFLVYLFVISLTALPIMRMYQKSNRKLPFDKIPFFLLSALFILPLLGTLILDIGGKSLGEFFIYFMLGYYLLSNENVIEKAEKYRFAMLSVSLVTTTLIILSWSEVITGLSVLTFDILSSLYAWVTILALFGIGKRSLNFKSKFTDYFVKSSFSIYIFHQTWIIVIGYYVLAVINNAYLQMLIILVASVITTFGTYEICKRLFITRLFFGITRS